MRKKVIIVSLLAIVIVVGTVSAILQYYRKNEPVKNGNAYTDVDIEKKIDECFKNYQRDVAAGMNLAMDREMCYITIAEEKGDYKICLNIKNNDIKNQCLRTVAEKVNDFSVCDEVVKGKNSCYFNIAVNTKNPIICQGDSYDGNLGPNECYYHISKINKDASLCDKIKGNKQLRSNCMQNTQTK